MATPRSTRNRPSLATPKFNVADVAKQATRRKPAPGYSFSEPLKMAPGYGEPTPTNLAQRPNTDIVPKEPLPQLVRGKDGKMVPFDPNAEAPVRSYEDIGASLAQDEYTQNLATELDITGEQKGYTSLEEYAADQYDALKESKQLQEAKLADQQLQTSEGVTQAEKSLRSQTLSGASRLAGNREGFVSSSNQSVASKLGRLASEKMQRINSQKDLVDMEIEDARANLDRAERAGSTQIAEQYRQVLDAAEYKARQIDTEYYNALSQQAQEKRANFTAFQGLVDSGQELDTETIAGFAEQLGIPFNDAYGYYKGQQAVRDNNKLTNDEKAIELQNLAYDFDRKLRGIETEQQIAIDFLKTMREKGFSEEEISAYKQMNGITDYDDPLTRAELEYQQLENEIKRKQMAGEPTSIAEMEALFDLRQKMNAEAGTGGTAYVSPSIDGISMSYEGGGLNVTLPRNPDGTLKAYQCGEFVNRAWGIPKGGAGGFGDYMSDKMNTVDKNGFRTEGMMAEQIASMIVPGMAFVSESGETGHVGLIVSGVDAQGNFQTLEANVGDGNPNVPDPPIYKTQNVKDQNIKGFAYPPNGAAIGGQDDAPIISTLDEKTIDNVRSEANSFRQEQIVKDYNVILNKQLSIQSILDSGVGGPGDLAIVYEFMKALDPGSVVRETEYATAAKSGNIFSGAFARYNGYLKEEGGFLPDTVKDSFKELIDLKFQSSQSQYDNLYQQYSQRINNLAGGKDVAPEVLTDYSAGFQSQPGKQVDPREILKEAKKQAYLESLVPDEDLAEFDSYFNY